MKRHFGFNRLLAVMIFLGLCGQAYASIELHVSPSSKEGNAGTAEAPLPSLDLARNRLRELRLTTPEAFTGGATVWVHAGVYEMPAPFSLGAEDGGLPDGIVYRAVEGESPELIGGKVLPPEAFLPVTDSTQLDRIPSEAKASALYVDLTALGITNLGEFPSAYNTPPAIPELFFNGTRMTLARWPNGDEWATIAGVVDSGPAPWRNHESQDKGTFTYAGDRPERWLTAPGVWLYGYWCFDWASETIRVEKIDPAQHSITLGKPHVYGIGSGNKAERRYCAVNLLEELDAPGEYYLDREGGRLYFWPTAPITPGSAVLSLLTEPVIMLHGASNITVKGLTVSGCAGNGIQVNDGTNILIQACKVRNTGLDGIAIHGGFHHVVEACDISETGTAGLVIEGGDRKTLTPSGHEAVNNDIWNIGRRMRTHAYNVHMNGVGVHLAHNRLHDAPHQAIGLGGNEHLIEYNEIYTICQESDDCGAFYMGRNPSERGNIIRYNFWRDTGGPMSHGSCAVYFDDGTGGQMVYGNVFLRAAGGNFGAVFMHGGHDNRVINNIFIDCKAAFRHVRWDDPRWKEWVDGELWHERLLKEVDVTQSPYRERYPELTGFFEFQGGVKRVNYASRNVAVRCPMLSDGDWELSDNLVTENDPGFVDAASMNFQLRDDSEVYQKIPGFARIPFDQIGMKRP